jgi:cytochrome d ubiquinol oxidase subunit II
MTDLHSAFYADVSAVPLWEGESSCCVIGARAFLLGMALFPNMVISAVSPEYNLTIYNAASSQKTLAIAALIALIGMPMVVTYTAIVYWVFRGKVRMGDLIY